MARTNPSSSGSSGPRGRVWQLVAAAVTLVAVILLALLVVLNRQGRLTFGAASTSTVGVTTTAPWVTTTVTATGSVAAAPASLSPATASSGVAPASGAVPDGVAPASGAAPAAAPPTGAASPATSSRAAASRAATLAVPAQTLPSTPPPTPVGRGPELGGGTDAPGDPQALPFATGVGLLGVGGLLAARTMLLWRRKVRRRVTR